MPYFFLMFYFSYVNIVLVHGTIFLKCLSFIGAKIFGKGASILTGLAEIVKKALKGYDFLLLWGERRALSLRSVTTG